MPVQRGQDRCSECKTPLPDEGACPNCGSTKRTVPLDVQAVVQVSGSVNRRLLISWQEVDRLLEKGEHAAALLVAAVNVEFVLWEQLRKLTPKAPPGDSHRAEKRTFERVTAGDRDSVGLGSLIQLAQFFVVTGQLDLAPPLKPFGWPLNKARRGIAHTRGFFARLTRLEDPDWPEARIRTVLDEAKTFCHRNAA